MLRTDVKPPVAWLALDRPDKLNAMTRGFFRELAAAVVGSIDDSAEVAVRSQGRRAVVLDLSATAVTGLAK